MKVTSDKLESNNFRITSMSSIEVSLMASNHQTEPSRERSSPRAQRPPPPPPSSQTQILTPPIEQTLTPSEIQTSPCAETSDEHGDSPEKDQLSLLAEFGRLFDAFDYETIREDILNRQMTKCSFTTVLWRIFLHCLPRDANQWNEMLDTSRHNYEKLVNQYKIDPYMMSEDKDERKNLNHPLSHDENSSWAQYFADEEQKSTITIDVQRTCPDLLFFRNPRMIDLQLQILFIHSRHHHKTTPYRQGMHEILGIVVYAIHTESLKIKEYPQSNELMKKIYDPQYLEHDAYAIFEKIMDHLRQYYALSASGSVVPKSVNVKDKKQIPFQKSNDVRLSANGTVARMNTMFERLRHYDRLLHCKLEEFQIEPTVYGIRWLRLLFGREIPFESIPNLWTVIFCFDEHFGFVDYFFIALIMTVGQIIGKQGEIGHTDYLASLMQQNVISNVEPVIRKALTLTGRQLQPVLEEPLIPSIRKTDGTRLNSIENDRENVTRAKQLQRIPIVRASQPRLTRPFLGESRKSTSPPQRTLSDHAMNPLKNNSSSSVPLTSPPQTSQAISTLDPEIDFQVEKTLREQYEDNLQVQKSCAEYMNKFIERLQKQICDLAVPSEDELHIQLSGLKQIMNVLDGTLTFEHDSLQALLKYECSTGKIEINNSDAGELSQ